MKNKQNSFSFYNGDNNVVISDAVGNFDMSDNPDALRNYEAALHSLADNPSTKHLYGYLMSDKEIPRFPLIIQRANGKRVI